MANNEEKKVYEYTPFQYGDYNKSDEVIAAEKKKRQAQNALAKYSDFNYSKSNSFADIMDKILNRERFSYDLNGDALYQQYKDKYIQQGKMAMGDAIGRASAMTGGYGNSYAQSVGQQTYQAHLNELNDIVPELYQMAFDRYNQEGQELYNKYGMLSDDKNTEYGIWSDGYNRLLGDRDYYSAEADSAFDKDYSKYVSDRALAHQEHSTTEGSKYQSIQDEIEEERWNEEHKLKENPREDDKETVDADGETDNYESDMYSDWNVGNWYDFFLAIRKSEGESAALEELYRMADDGLIPADMMAAAMDGAKQGSLHH